MAPETVIGTKLAVPKGRLSKETESHFVFRTDDEQAIETAMSAVLGVAEDRLRQELAREPDDDEVRARAADIAAEMADDLRRVL